MTTVLLFIISSPFGHDLLCSLAVVETIIYNFVCFAWEYLDDLDNDFGMNERTISSFPL
jgi:hypothetical protein